MAPISPMKRSSPPHSQDGSIEEHTSKRARLENEFPVTPPPEEEEKWQRPVVKTTMFDDDPRQLLERSIALACNHVGFEAASKEAMEAFCAEVDTC